MKDRRPVCHLPFMLGNHRGTLMGEALQERELQERELLSDSGVSSLARRYARKRAPSSRWPPSGVRARPAHFQPERRRQQHHSRRIRDSRRGSESLARADSGAFALASRRPASRRPLARFGTSFFFLVAQLPGNCDYGSPVAFAKTCCAEEPFVCTGVGKKGRGTVKESSKRKQKRKWRRRQGTCTRSRTTLCLGS